MNTDEKQKCPWCSEEQAVKRIFSKKTNTFWHTCEKCQQFFPDRDGQPDLSGFQACPICEKRAVKRFQAKSGVFWWSCKACTRLFADNNGQLVPPETCPACDARTLSRIARKDNSGFFHKCDKCSTFFDDENGRPVPSAGPKGGGKGKGKK